MNIAMRSSIIIAVLLSANIYANETNMEVVKTKPVFRNISVQTPVSYEQKFAMTTSEIIKEL